jgi:exopolysaccharide biosynthesis predicted pyruvyltransferase EpsI
MDVAVAKSWRAYCREMIADKSFRVLFVPNPGNAGDSLINLALVQVLDECEVNYIVGNLSYDQSCSGYDLVVLAACGTITRDGHIFEEIYSKLDGDDCKVVFAPCTIHNSPKFINKLRSNTVVLCREAVTFNYLRDNSVGAEIVLSEDAALGLEVSFFPPITRTRHWWMEFRALLKAANCSCFMSYVRERLVGGRELFAPRMDVEAGDQTWCSNTDRFVDVSEVFSVRRLLLADISASAVMFLRFIDRYDVVHTDRLHVAIAAALLGKTVHIHPGSYHKIQSIYDHSMADRFDHVIMHAAGGKG